MKKVIIILAAFLATSCTVNAQKVVKLPNGNFEVIKATSGGQVAGKPTGNTIKDDGKDYPVLISSRGNLYYMKVSKTGTTYKKYLPK